MKTIDRNKLLYNIEAKERLADLLDRLERDPNLSETTFFAGGYDREIAELHMLLSDLGIPQEDEHGQLAIATRLELAVWPS